MSGTRNTLQDLNNHLFAQLERLDNEELQGGNLAEEIERSEAITKVAQQIVNNAGLQLKAIQVAKDIDGGIKSMPRMLVGNTEYEK